MKIFCVSSRVARSYPRRLVVRLHGAHAQQFLVDCLSEGFGDLNQSGQSSWSQTKACESLVVYAHININRSVARSHECLLRKLGEKFH